MPVERKARLCMNWLGCHNPDSKKCIHRKLHTDWTCDCTILTCPWTRIEGWDEIVCMEIDIDEEAWWEIHDQEKFGW